MEDCALCQNEIHKHSDRFIKEDDHVTIIENLRPYYPTKHAEGKQRQFLIIPNRHCDEFQVLSPDTRRAVYHAKRYILENFGPADYISGCNTGPVSGASIPTHYHLHFTLIYDECSACKLLKEPRALIKDYDTVAVILDHDRTAEWHRCYLLAPKRHNAHPLNYTNKEIDDLVLAESDLREFLSNYGYKNMNTMENFGPQSYFDTPVMTSHEVTSCGHTFIRLVTRHNSMGGGVGYGSMTNLKFFSQSAGSTEDSLIEEFKKSPRGTLAKTQFDLTMSSSSVENSPRNDSAEESEGESIDNAN